MAYNITQKGDANLSLLEYGNKSSVILLDDINCPIWFLMDD